MNGYHDLPMFNKHHHQAGPLAAGILALGMVAMAGKGFAVTIHLGPDATSIERTAARFLAEDWPEGGSTEATTIYIAEASPESGSIVMGTPASSPIIHAMADELRVSELGDEGYVVQRVQREGRDLLVVASGGPRGVLYGSAALLEQQRLGFKSSDIDLRETPKLAERCIWFWNGPRPRKSAFFSIDRMANVENEPCYQAFGRFLAQARLNTVMIWAHHRTRPDWGDGVESTRETYRKFCRYFRENFGVEIFLFMWYEIEQGTKPPIQGYPICPFDPRVQKHWEGVVENLKTIPEMRGIIMAGAGGDWIRGPWECECERCRQHTDRELLLRAMKMIGEPWSEAGGRIIWKAVTDRPTRVPSEVEHFANLDDVLPPYVQIAHKNLYKDFRQPHPIHPMFYAHEDDPDHERPYLCEFQIYGEYRGGTEFPCVMIDRWAEIFPLLAKKRYRGAIAVTTIASHNRWDHPLNLANWYGFGRFAWNPEESPDVILRDWATLKFGRDVADEIVEICRTTYDASTKMMFFRGVMTQNHSKLPTIDYELESSLIGPWHDIPKAPDGYWGRGHDVSKYPPDVAEAIRNDPKLLLWAHRVPITEELCDEAIAGKKEALELVRDMAARWEALPHAGWEKTHEDVSRQFEKNLVDAEVWYLTTKIYFDYKAGRLTKSDLKRRIADIRDRFDPEDGSGLIRETFDACLGEWTRITKNYLKRVSMPGAHQNPAGEDFLPGLKQEDEGDE